MAGPLIVKFGILLAGALFVFAAVRPALSEGTLDVTFFIIGVACVLLGLTLLRKPGGPQGSAGA